MLNQSQIQNNSSTSYDVTTVTETKINFWIIQNSKRLAIMSLIQNSKRLKRYHEYYRDKTL